MGRKSERTITLALSALSSPVDRAAPSERAARWVWDAVSQGSANRKEGHCERKYNREMESRDPIEGQTWPDWTSARRTREERICSDWKLIRVVSGPRRTTRKVGRIVGSFVACSRLLNVTAELIGGERDGRQGRNMGFKGRFGGGSYYLNCFFFFLGYIIVDIELFMLFTCEFTYEKIRSVIIYNFVAVLEKRIYRLITIGEKKK